MPEDDNPPIGIGSPWALAELVSDEPIDWNRADVGEILKQKLGLTLETIYKPGSPILSPDIGGVPIHQVRRKGSDWTIHHAGQGFGRPDFELIEKLRPEVLIRPTRFKPGSSRRGKKLSPAPAPKPTTLKRRIPGRWSDMGDFGLPSWESLKQGNYTVCYFLASMISLLLAGRLEQPREPRVLLSNSTRSFRLHETRRSAKDIAVDELLLLQAGRTPFSRDRFKGLWPGLWEKAYACLRNGKVVNQPDTDVLEHMGTVSDGFVYLTGQRPKKVDVAEFAAKPNLGPIVEPTVASSKATTVLTYNISPLHAYSVLGAVLHGGVKYIILNNPSGVREFKSARKEIFVWEALEGAAWTERHSKLNRRANSGVLPVTVAQFVDNFARVDVLE